MIEVVPKISEALLSNPGIGFIAAPHMMGDLATVHDNLGNDIPTYKFRSDSLTNNQPDSRVYYCGTIWKDLEPKQGIYNWSLLEDQLEKAGAMGCISVVRCMPYALDAHQDIPGWFREAYPEEAEFPFWRIDPNTTPYAEYWASFIKAFAEHFDGHPLISSVDMTIVGAWGEGGGTEFLEVKMIEEIVKTYAEGFKKTPLKALLHDPISVEIIRRHCDKVGFRVDCLGDMGGFHGEEWSHMLDFYPQNIVNFHMQDAWKTGPVVFEACWYMCDWYRQGWDIDYIISESLKWHISSFNGKGTPVPKEWQASIEAWVNKMGYRFQLRRFGFSEEALVGGQLSLDFLWANVGVAPIYTRYPLVIRLSSEQESHVITSRVDITQWLPDMDIYWDENLQLPETISPGAYEIAVGIETQIPEIGNILLGIEGHVNGYYPMGNIVIKKP